VTRLPTHAATASVLLAAAWLLMPTPLLSQGQQCVFQIDNVDRQGAVVETPQGTNYFAGGNVRLSCRGTTISMASDSVAAYGGNVVQFIGRVKYRDSTLTMDADRGTYFKNRERWEARGRVVTKNLVTGSTLTGPSLDYMRVVKGVRDTMEMFATGRPSIQYFPSDTGGQKPEPYVIVGDRVRLKGDDRIFAGGKVTVDRSDFASRSDSLRLDTGPGGDGSLIGGRPVLRGIGADSFSITGNRIDLKLEGRELTYLLAKGNGKAVNKEWELVADTIALDVNRRKLEQTLAWGDSLRPSATSTSYAMKADSLALDTPGQRLREVRGFGRAWLGGTVYQPTKDRDWMRGDTVIARFAARDSAGTQRAVLSQIQARKAAQSYHLEPNERAPTLPSVNYARGDVITVTMKNGPATAGSGVDRVDIRGKVDGIQLEAAPPSAAPPDSTPGGGGTR
jgi:lipopolysaccharide export system protein LptA